MITINPKVFFFDFDGVICNSEKAHMLAALKALEPHQIDFTEDYYFEKLLGFDDRDLFKYVFDEKGQTKLDKEALKKLLKDKNKVFMSQVEKHIIYFDGVVDFINDLHAKKIPLAVVSGARSREVIACLKKGGLDSLFKFFVCADHVTHSKPHRDPYEKAYLKMLGMVDTAFSPDECWVLEDSPAGILSAQNAGMKTIGITNSLPRSDLALADHVIDHYREIKLA